MFGTTICWFLKLIRTNFVLVEQFLSKADSFRNLLFMKNIEKIPRKEKKRIKSQMRCIANCKINFEYFQWQFKTFNVEKKNVLKNDCIFIIQLKSIDLQKNQLTLNFLIKYMSND